MPILPLPQFEADLEADRKAYEALQAPKTIVVRFGAMRMIGEFPTDGSIKPGCGSKLVIRTRRGTEIATMLTSTCPNAGCGHAVSRKEMLQYIDNSGGRDYPFGTDGRILRVATVDDLNRQAAMDARKNEMVHEARAIAQRLNLNLRISDVEPILGGERLTFFFMAEERVEFAPLVMELASIHRTRIEMQHVGARDEARLVADYEKCGQHCCCKQFLKVLKPISMRNAKIQKATLDPLKISGRCGRLMCCLRYEESTYDDLRKNLPRKKSMVMTPDGPGLVLDSQILTQLVLVSLDKNGEQAAYPVETITPIAPGSMPPPPAADDEGEEPANPAGAGREPGSAPQRGPGGPRPDQRSSGPPGAPRRDQGQRGQGGPRPPGDGRGGNGPRGPRDDRDRGPSRDGGGPGGPNGPGGQRRGPGGPQGGPRGGPGGSGGQGGQGGQGAPRPDRRDQPRPPQNQPPRPDNREGPPPAPPTPPSAPPSEPPAA